MKKRNVKSQLFLNKEIISRQIRYAVTGGINDEDENGDEDGDNGWVNVTNRANICSGKNERHN
ncbi:hypothetical protein [uncultured Kordia sp.]|uniref:hypothetical protein n=1 Tax=uncultured Kordia sp. TaxID=507699 RepID=UPI0026016D6D|nr:hypothetical protein [uncultured Kordia sp.]